MKNGWQKKQLGELADLKGRIGWRGLTAKEYTESGPLFLSVHSLNYGDYIDFRDAFHISEERYVESPEIMIQEGDVLICKDGAGIGKVGIVGELPDRTTINSSLLLIRSGDSILPKFLYRCLSSPYFQKIVNSRLNGATTPHLYQRDITEFPVVVPPLPEQQRIVGILDEAFAGIATAKANVEKNIQNARALFESYLQSVFTQRGPGWELKTLGDLFDITSSKRVFESDWTTAGVPFYRAREIVKLARHGFVENDLFISDEMFNRYSTKYGIPVEGDIMVTGVGTLGICYVVKKDDRFYFKDGNIIWLKKKIAADSRFVEHAFRSDFLRKQIDDSVGATVGTFTIIKAKGTLIPLPPASDQPRIVEQLDSLREETQRLAILYERKLAALEALKKSLLHQAFTGQL